MDVNTSEGGALLTGAVLDTRFGFRGSARAILPRRSCRWCAPITDPRVFHRACGIHELGELDAETYGRMARIAIATMHAATYPGARDDDWRPMLAAQAVAYARLAAMAALRLLGREETEGGAR